MPEAAEFVEVQELRPAHAPAVAEIHSEGQPGTFLTSLGKEFLTTLYGQIASSPLGFGRVALLDGEVVGFVVATVDTAQLFKEMAWQRWPQLGPSLARQVLRHPSLLMNILQTLSYLGQGGEGGSGAELLSIGVRAGLRGRGIGGQLLDALVEECRARAIPALAVTVDAANEGAHRFYQQHSFHHRRTFELYGRRMDSYGLDLRDEVGEDRDKMTGLT